MIVIGSVLMTGLPAFAYHLIQEAACIILFVWLLKRKERGRVLGIVLSAYHMLLAGLQFVVCYVNPQEYFRTMEKMAPGYSELVPSGLTVVMLGGSAVVSWIIGSAMIAYLYFKKHHFRP
jgi:hypothetical protein